MSVCSRTHSGGLDSSPGPRIANARQLGLQTEEVRQKQGQGPARSVEKRPLRPQFCGALRDVDGDGKRVMAWGCGGGL